MMFPDSQVRDYIFGDPSDAARLEWGVAPLRFVPSRELLEAVSAAMVESWLDCSLLRHPFFSVVQNHEPVSLDEVGANRVVAGVAYDGYIDGTAVRARLARGATLLLANVHEWHAPMRTVCGDLAQLTGCKTGAVVFWTGPDSPGLRVHRDDCHVFIVQLAGAKRWRLYDVPADAAAWAPGFLTGVPAHEPTVIDLQAGDAVYVPKGQAHATESVGGSSLHLSITVREPEYRELIQLALQACTANVPKHRALTGERNERERAAKAYLEQVADALGRVNVSKLVASLEKRVSQTKGSA